jgi:hypothetical protein
MYCYFKGDNLSCILSSIKSGCFVISRETTSSVTEVQSNQDVLLFKVISRETTSPVVKSKQYVL